MSYISFFGRGFPMADEPPEKNYTAAILFTMFWISLLLGGEQAITRLARGPALAWSGIGCIFVLSLLCFVGSVRWEWIKSKIAEFLPWRQLRVAKAELADLKRRLSTPHELRLEIISASWGIEGIEVYDVKPELVEKQHGNSLVERVTVGLFHGRDPVKDNPNKVLKVRYSFDGQETTIIRREWSWVALPENRLLEDRLGRLQWELEQAKAKSVAGQEAAKQPLNNLLSPLQIEALTLAKELRDFIAAMPLYPSGPTQDPGEDDHTFMMRHISEQSTLRLKWQQKLEHAYANRGIGPRITSFLHRFAEAFDDAPVGNASYAEDLGFPTDDKTIPKLAQQMEMIAIWINRKERGEVNLLPHLCHNCGRMADP